MRNNIDSNMGLSSEEVKKLTEQGFSNIAVKSQSKTIGQIIAGNVFTYFNLVFAIFTAMLILVRSYVNMTFLPIIICNTFIGIIQEIRSKNVLDKLNVLNAPKSRVIRDGQECIVNSETLVKGELCIFSAGNQMSADAVVISGRVLVNESLITGEADEIIKEEGDKLLSGSFVVSGECRARLENVGLDSYASKLMLEAKASRKKQQTEMMRSLDGLVKIIGLLIIPLGVCLFVQDYYFLHFSVKDSVVSVVAALVGMIPEGLYLLASVALVVSVMKLGKKNVLVHEMNCVETLARVNVLCVDKTGTITENHMSVREIVPLNNMDTDMSIHNMISDMVDNLETDNETMKAVKEYFDEDTYEPHIKAVTTYSFSSETKYSAVVFDDGVSFLGAPEKLLLDDFSKYENLIKSFAAKGIRVLVFGVYTSKNETQHFQGGVLSRPVEPLALVLINNKIREQAKDTFRYFAKQGVEIKVISGDNPLAVSSIAAEAGIDNSDRYIDASTLKTDEEIETAVSEYTVFGRVQPEQKKKFVMALKRSGKVVGMTGDGVNDVLALKSADCSVAMASGSEAASNAAQIVLLDSDFSCMPSVVLEGRRVVNNIQRSASLFLVKNIFSMLLTVYVIFAAKHYPLYPTQLSLLGAFTIGIPAFFLALQPSHNLIEGRFITNVLIKALPAGLTDFIVVSFLVAYGRFNGIAHEQLSTMTVFVLISVGIITLIRVCRPFDKIRLAVCMCMVAGITFSVIFLKKLFSIYELTVNQMLITGVLMLVSLPLFVLMCYLVEYLRKKIKRKK